MNYDVCYCAFGKNALTFKCIVSAVSPPTSCQFFCCVCINFGRLLPIWQRMIGYRAYMKIRILRAKAATAFSAS